MALQTAGMHHVTAIVGDAQVHYDFYHGVLGLRLVKRTINFDDPETYHLYFGGATGQPGTIFTSFPWGNDARMGRAGRGQVTAVSLAIPPDSVDYWLGRLREHGHDVEEPFDLFGEQVIRVGDPDEIMIELVATDDAGDAALWPDGPVPSEHAVRGVHTLLLHSWDPAATASFMADELGFESLGEDGGRMRLQAAGGGPASRVDLLTADDQTRGRMGVGAIHHVAWRAADDQQQLAWLERLRELEYNVTDVRDRQYFRSIYFREPGGITFEIATDTPGFGIDESSDELGSELRLPSWLEERRQEITAQLPALVTRS